ncbi:hypothetical protein GUITHDRAFT_62975 [Guillardia theta CCMP2712]|uniref:F-box domain-containing protein n=1 Tax=Guillardia theta (strain CCMP2712) TaxID=905079 RepID=L1K3D2_GUITC|nr:hypothetical protein GUITHDRAFT_62975 [Guillardia theta CCMP2712]EKX54868.1 hypothetical protein GUITHDRAFT_62975 [Guillardia theta CCMP2712]|eukprot:XP_005841848.1 hypothetical protein GUITHDRAFT_62975 [Guillardia theta CCMP2712]
MHSFFVKLPVELLARVMNHLKAEELLACSCVCKVWKTSALDHGCWLNLCHKLWEGRSYVPSRFLEMAETHEGVIRAYFASIKDAKRCSITTEELCSFEWSFRFKRSAGRFWTRSDPYWNGSPARTVKFHPEGLVKWESDWTRMRWKFVEIPDQTDDNDEEDKIALTEGKAIRIEHLDMGRFPTELVQRHRSWGFILNSPWVVYASFPMVRSNRDRQLSDKVLEKRVRPWQWIEADEYNMLQIESGSDSD